MEFNYVEFFSPSVSEFIRKMAQSVSSCEAYFIPSLITTTSFVAGMNSVVVNKSQTMPLNMFTVVVGPPTTGKSAAMSECSMNPLLAVRNDNDMGNFLLERSTTSGMVKCICEQKKAFVASPEIYDFLNKLLKSDEENASGEVQLLCELFSGERTSFRYATECIREIPANLPFCMLGFTQVPLSVKLLCRLDQGHGLLDRFFFLFPRCLRPSPQESEEAKTYLASGTLKSFTDVFVEMFESHRVRKSYSFTAAAEAYIISIQEDFIQELNDSLLKGVPTPKSKKVDLIQRVAVSVHVFNHITTSLIKGQKPRPPSSQVTIETLKKAQAFVDFAESQKQLVTDVSMFSLLLTIACIR